MFKKLTRSVVSFYRPNVYLGFNEGISVSLFPKSRILRFLAGWEPIASCLRLYPQLAPRSVNSRIVEIPHLFMGLARYGRDLKKVLDFGCVESKVAIHLANLGFEVAGVDLRTYEFKGFHPNLRFFRKDVFELNEFGSYDLIIAMSVLEHVGLEAYGQNVKLSQGDILAMRHLSKLLKPGGTMYLTVPYGTRFLNLGWQRIYDHQTLNQLVEGFAILERHVYARTGNTWGFVSQDVPSGTGEAVTLLWLRKCDEEAT